MDKVLNPLTNIERAPIPADISESFLRCIVTSFGSLTYETIFVIDIESGKLCFLSDTSGLSHMILDKKKSFDSFKEFMETISGKDAQYYDLIISLIKRHYSKYCIKNPETLLYVTDLDYVFNDGIKTYVTYKFAPYLIDSDGKLRFLAGSVSDSTGKYKGRLVAVNTSSQYKQICTFENGFWRKYETKPLSSIELAVFEMSVQGVSVNAIAKHIHRAPDSVKSIRKRIFEKLGVSNITEAIIFAITHKIV